jgi:NDP-sugar pyrophosphorylase family protein
LCDGAPTAREIIAVEAVRYIGSSVAELLELHRRTGAWATLGVNPDGSPGGVYILSPEAVDLVPRSGFLDLKEQLLRKVRDVGGEVRGQFLPSPGGLSLRTRAEFLRAIASIQGEDPEGPGAYGTRAEAATEAGSRVGSVVSREANVHEHATLLHSLAMPGSTVEAGAVVARSILLPGATVVKGGSLVDAVATASGVVKDAPQRGLLRKRA